MYEKDSSFKIYCLSKYSDILTSWSEKYEK